MSKSDSVSVSIGPSDRRCRYWAKIVRAGTELPMPADVDSYNLPGEFLRKGEEVLRSGDFLFEGEANHHSKQRGWTYWVYYLDDSGKLVVRYRHWAAFKAELKAAAGCYDPALLKGAGDLAACVRFAHVHRFGGLTVMKALSQALASKALLLKIAKGAH